MLERFVTKIQSFVADVVAWRINRYAEKCALALLEQVHTGASLDWLTELVEQRGRHALLVPHH